MAKYQEWIEGENLILIEGWARDGLTDEQIAHNMGIAYSTFKEWKKKYSAFSATLKRNKEVVDRIVENSLFKRAVGYDYEEVTKERRKNPDTDEYEEVVTKRVLKHVAPDVTAQIYWLKNRKPDVWREKQAAETNNEALEAMYQQLDINEERARKHGNNA